MTKANQNYQTRTNTNCVQFLYTDTQKIFCQGEKPIIKSIRDITCLLSSGDLDMCSLKSVLKDKHFFFCFIKNTFGEKYRSDIGLLAKEVSKYLHT